MEWYLTTNSLFILFAVPQWAYWSEWTGCSVSCGRGQQTRQRLCDNEFDTKDGYRQRCNQPGSELHHIETRDCPLKGVHDFCPCEYINFVIPILVFT